MKFTCLNRVSRSVLGYMLGVLTTSGAASATCWDDTQVSQQARSIAERLFPDVASKMPAVVVCTGDTFAARIGGDFNGGFWRIRIPQWEITHPELPTVIAHELAHAPVFMRGMDDGVAGGHGKAWMKTMLEVGLYAEANRTSKEVAGADVTLAQALDAHRAQEQEPVVVASATPSALRARKVTVCYYQPRILRYREMSGQVVTKTFWDQSCSDSK